MEIRRYVVTIATADDVDNHVSAEELADCLSDYIGISYANLVECYRISNLQVVDSGVDSPMAVPEADEQPETDAPTEEHTGYQGLCVDTLPAEAKYIATDESGRVYWYPAKPVRMQHGWFCEDVTWKEHLASELDIEYLGNWEDSLYELPAKDCTAIHKDTPTGVPEPEVVDAVELTAEQQTILDAPQQAELPPEQPAHDEADMSRCEQCKYPYLDVSRLNPPADARWVAVDSDGTAYYYA